MAKAEPNSGLKELWGGRGGFVLKQYEEKVVVSRRPRMDQIKPSPSQRAQRERFHAAAKFHREVLADPALKQHYETLAQQQLGRDPGRLHAAGEGRGAAMGKEDILERSREWSEGRAVGLGLCFPVPANR